MTDIAKTYYDFWSSIAPAFIDESVPNGTDFPYITYNLSYTPFSIDSLHQVKIWTRSKSIEQVSKIQEKIHNLITEQGTILYLPKNKGCLFLYRGTPFSQIITGMGEHPDIKVIYVNVTTKTYMY